MFMNPKTANVTENEREFGKRILAYYFYSAFAPPDSREEGTLGYRDEKTLYTSRYKKLF